MPNSCEIWFDVYSLILRCRSRHNSIRNFGSKRFKKVRTIGQVRNSFINCFQCLRDSPLSINKMQKIVINQDLKLYRCFAVANSKTEK